MDVEFEELAKILGNSDIVPGRENSHLREEHAIILEQTRDLAYCNYKTFIHAADCSHSLFKDFSMLEKHLEGVVANLPVLQRNSENFLENTQSLARSRHLTSLTLDKHTQIMEVLELPQLMDTCVRNGYYDEALDIVNHIKRMERKLSEIPIIANIIKEIQNGTRLMLLQLLSQLRSPLSLPQCLKVVSYLRRLEAFTEPELRLKFLQARDSWFSNIVKNIPKEDAFQHVLKVIEASRVHLFDIVTQYRAIFSEDDSRFAFTNSAVNDQAFFYNWIALKVEQFMSTVEKDLKRGVGNNLETVLTQCMFFGHSFSRIGADFRSLLIPLFCNLVVSQFEKDVQLANFKFDETFSCFSLLDSQQISSTYGFLPEIKDSTSAPLTLMEFPPLAHYTNGLVSAFNNLRQCCPVSVIKDVLRLLNQSLKKVVSALVELHRLESSGFTSKETVIFSRMCEIVYKDLIPYVNRCLWLLFPPAKVGDVIGINIVILQKQNFFQLDGLSVTDPLRDYLPKLDEIDRNELDKRIHDTITVEHQESVNQEEVVAANKNNFAGMKDAVIGENFAKTDNKINCETLENQIQVVDEADTAYLNHERTVQAVNENIEEELESINKKIFFAGSTDNDVNSTCKTKVTFY